MRKILVTRKFFKASGPQCHFFEKAVFTYGLEEFLYQISGLFRLSFGQGAETKSKTHRTDRHTSIRGK